MPAHATVTRTCEQCGESFTISQARLQWKAGRFCSRRCREAYQRSPRGKTEFSIRVQNRKAGTDHPSWRGGVNLTSDGYARVRIAPGKYALQHRLVMERHLGRPLRADEEVHHRDGNRTNNDFANLQLMDKAEHARLHAGKFDRWSRDYEFCVVCGGRDRPHTGNGECARCKARRRYRERKNERVTLPSS
jgi:hypothetical protein